MRLRIEDLDTGRVRAGSLEGCLADLRWLGLDWDGEPVLQSRDTSALEAACEKLLAGGMAFPCVCSRAEVAALSAPHASEAEVRYPGTCRDRFRSLEQAERDSGRPAGLRVRAPGTGTLVEDAFAGARIYHIAKEVGDFLIRRRDGAYAYQLAVVVDDARQGVTEVVRGDDLMPSAARQSHLQQLLGLPTPVWHHVPLVLDESGVRLAKRRSDLSLAQLRARGVDPRAVVAWAARVSGQLTAERMAPEELLAHFDIDRVPRDPVMLNGRELEALRASRA